MPRLRFQRRRDGSFVYFPGAFSVTGAYEVPDDALADTARAAHDWRRWGITLYTLTLAFWILGGALVARPLSIEFSAAFDADRATIETALRLAGLLAALLLVALLSEVRRRRFQRRHLRGFAYAADERRAVLFRPRVVYGASDVRGTALGMIAAVLVFWGVRLYRFPAAYAEGKSWAVVVEAEVACLVMLAVAYCVFMVRHARRLRRRRAKHADASEIWAEMDIASGWQKRRRKRKAGPRPLIWRILLPEFGYSRAANKLEVIWMIVVWPLALLFFAVLLEVYGGDVW